MRKIVFVVLLMVSCLNVKVFSQSKISIEGAYSNRYFFENILKYNLMYGAKVSGTYAFYKRLELTLGADFYYRNYLPSYYKKQPVYEPDFTNCRLNESFLRVPIKLGFVFFNTDGLILFSAVGTDIVKLFHRRNYVSSVAEQKIDFMSLNVEVGLGMRYKISDKLYLHSAIYYLSQVSNIMGKSMDVQVGLGYRFGVKN